MKSRVQTILVLLCLATGRSLYAQASQDASLSLQGTSGVLNTPNAQVQKEGTIAVAYSNQRDEVPGNGVPKWQDNYLFSIGMFSFAEVGGRLTNSAALPYVPPIRHLSFQVKLSSAPWTSHLRFSPTLAVGTEDTGGQTHYFRTKYVVGSVDPVGWLRLSGGYGDGPDRMKGAFGGAELKALEWVTLLADYDTSKTNVGGRLITPTLPIVPVRLVATFSTPIQSPHDQVISAGLVIPFDFKRSDRHAAAAPRSLLSVLTGKRAKSQASESAYQPYATASQSSKAAALPSYSAASVATPTKPAPDPSFRNNKMETVSQADAGPATLETVRGRLIKDGFVNVRVGQQGNTLVVEYENIRYNHSELDAIGVVLGIASQASGAGGDRLRVVVKRRDLAVLQIETPLLPLRDWLNGNGSTSAPELTVTQKLSSEQGTNFIIGETNPGRLKPSLMISPALTTLIGTENGVFDYLLTVRPELQVPLWHGATTVARADLPVAWTPNLNDGKVYSGYRTPPRLDRAMFFQAFTLAPGLVANVGGGKILTTNYGTLNEVNWMPGEGMNRLKVIQSWGRDGGSTRNVLLGAYRLFLARHDLAFEATAGRFYAQDNGALVSMQRFFGDSAVSLYFKDTVTQSDNKRWMQAGIEFEFPLTPRRDMKPRPIQIRGNPDWTYAQETVIGQSANYLQSNLAIIPETPQALDLSFYDRARLNADYVLSHKERIRDAWQLFRAGL